MRAGTYREYLVNQAYLLFGADAGVVRQPIAPHAERRDRAEVWPGVRVGDIELGGVCRAELSTDRAEALRRERRTGSQSKTKEAGHET